MRRKTNAVSFLVGMLTAAAALSLTACQAANTVNDPEFVRAADSFVNRSVGPDFVAYVLADLSLDDLQKEDRIQNVRTFRDTVAKAQLELAGTPAIP